MHEDFDGEVRRLLAEADQHDRQAEDARVAAGELLLRAGAVERPQVARGLGLDRRVIELLTSMALGRRLRGGRPYRPAAPPDRPGRTLWGGY